jgi:hypothetical protein
MYSGLAICGPLSSTSFHISVVQYLTPLFPYLSMCVHIHKKQCVAY